MISNDSSKINNPDLEKSQQNGFSAYVAASNGDHELLENLLEDFEIMKYVDELTGMMPIHIAAAWGNVECIDVLVKRGCDINQLDRMNCSPIHHAARNGHAATVEWLIKHGASATECNLFGQYPSDMALANHFPELSDQIRREGISGIWLHGKNVCRLLYLDRIIFPGFVSLHFHLALACLGAISPFAFSAISAFFQQWMFGQLGCQIYAFVGMICGMAAILLPCQICILHLIQLRKYSFAKQMKSIHYHLIAVLTWIYGFFWAILPILGFGKYDIEPNQTTCLFDWLHMDRSTYYYMISLCIFGYIIPINGAIYAQFKSMQIVEEKFKQTKNNNNKLYKMRKYEKLQITTKLNGRILLFTILGWFPFTVIALQSLFYHASTNYSNHLVYYYTPQLIAKLFCTLMPLVYVVSMRKLSTAKSPCISSESSEKDD